MNYIKIIGLLLAAIVDYYLLSINQTVPKEFYIPYALWIIALLYIITEYDMGFNKKFIIAAEK